ncbi:hypothetical protein JXB02_03985 [Candidatus Woesearchaeota archaeon]|nr:hypothetical protein [Candidatus Woesearchaeota archaeon]
MRTAYRKALALCINAIFFLTAVAYAMPVEIVADKVWLLDEGDPTRVYDYTPTFYVGTYVEAGVSYDTKSIIDFKSLPDLPSVEQAYLEISLYPYAEDVGFNASINTSLPLKVKDLADVAENPAYIGGYVISNQYEYTAYSVDIGRYRIDVTGMVNDWLATPSSEKAVLLEGDTALAGTVKEYDNTLERPKLILITDPVDILDLDPDGDGLTIDEEIQFKIDPYRADSDADGMTDVDEIAIYKTDPTNSDSDGDTLPDGFEIKNLMDPRLVDSNGNGIHDGLEVQMGDNPRNALNLDGDDVIGANDICPVEGPYGPELSDEGVGCEMRRISRNGCCCADLDGDGRYYSANDPSGCAPLDVCPYEGLAVPAAAPNANQYTMCTSVGKDGCCQPDADADGVPDKNDNCPQTPAGEKVNARGCLYEEDDTDGDGMRDNVDPCPSNPNNDCGCNHCGVNVFGFTLFCEADECHALRDGPNYGCFYSPASPDKCVSCVRPRCSAYDTRAECAADPCGASKCEWVDDACRRDCEGDWVIAWGPCTEQGVQYGTRTSSNPACAAQETFAPLERPCTRSHVAIDFDGDLKTNRGDEPLVAIGHQFFDFAVDGQSVGGFADDEYAEYDGSKYFDWQAGTVSLWVYFDRFTQEDAVFFHTPDSKYVVYYDYCHGCVNVGNKRMKGRAGGTEAVLVFDQGDTSPDYPNSWQGSGWHHVVMTWDGAPSGLVSLYVDGTLADAKLYSYGAVNTRFRIGNNYGLWMGWHEGKLDQFKLYNHPLEAEDVRLLYEKEKALIQLPPACADIYEPVCGKDGTTYSNVCYAAQAGIAVAYEGRCVDCVEYDNGNSPEISSTIFGYYRQTGSVLETVDECVDGKRLHEYFCNQEGFVDDVLVTCGTSCVDGVCIASGGCFDSDGGQNYGQFGWVNATVTGSSWDAYFDDCLDRTHLIEYYCQGNAVGMANHTCTDECSGGACVVGR